MSSTLSTTTQQPEQKDKDARALAAMLAAYSVSATFWLLFSTGVGSWWLSSSAQSTSAQDLG
jgi:hypothetical protein